MIKWLTQKRSRTKYGYVVAVIYVTVQLWS